MLCMHSALPSRVFSVQDFFQRTAYLQRAAKHVPQPDGLDKGKLWRQLCQAILDALHAVHCCCKSTAWGVHMQEETVRLVLIP